MSAGHRLVAWIEPKDGHWAAASISEATRWLRAPAIRHFSSVHEARGWVEQEAAALGGIPVAWVNQPNDLRQAGRSAEVVLAEVA
jgi:hypothetical protein